ncbi:hypothetical protein IW18_190 [Vibrio phage IW18]|nr:hypothetical protein IW18_190 [Vibrio phage IW18]
MNFAKRLDALVAQMNDLKDEFRTTIADTQRYSLRERWEMFEKAPYELVSGCSCSSVVGEDLVKELLEIEGSLCIYSDLYVDRYQTVNMLSVVETIVEHHAEKKGDYDFDLAFEELMVNPTFGEFLEEILESGIREFQFDW